jgi:hypothetical protein
MRQRQNGTLARPTKWVPTLAAVETRKKTPNPMNPLGGKILMKTESTAIDEITLPQVVTRLQMLEEQLVDLRVQFQYTLPRFEFVIEVDGKMAWAGLDLANQYSQMRRQYPGKELVISWHSSPVVQI